MSYKVNSFPIKKGGVNLTSGSIEGSVLCVDAGSITVTWDDDTTSVIDFENGWSMDLINVKSAVVTTGKFHCA